MPAPSYSATDYAAAVGVVACFGLDVLTGYGFLPAVDPATRVPLMASLTLLAGAGIAAYIKNRGNKHAATALVAAAVASAPPAPVAVAPPAPVAVPVMPFTGGSFTIVPTPSPAPEPAPKPKPPTSGTPPPTQQHLAADTGLPSTPPQP